MSPQARWEYMKTIRERYIEAKGKREKGSILDEFCKTYEVADPETRRMIRVSFEVGIAQKGHR